MLKANKKPRTHKRIKNTQPVFIASRKYCATIFQPKTTSSRRYIYIFFYPSSDSKSSIIASFSDSSPYPYLAGGGIPSPYLADAGTISYAAFSLNDSSHDRFVMATS